LKRWLESPETANGKGEESANVSGDAFGRLEGRPAGYDKLKDELTRRFDCRKVRAMESGSLAFLTCIGPPTAASSRGADLLPP
jgi:hypothetical protein